MVTNRDDLKIPHFRTDSKEEIESFFRAMGTMEYAQDDGLRIALTSRQPPALTLREYPFVSGPLRRIACRINGRASTSANRLSKADSAFWPGIAWRFSGRGAMFSRATMNVTSFRGRPRIILN